MTTANGGGSGRMACAGTTLGRIRSVDAVRQLENFVQHNDRCQFCDKASCATAWQVSQSWQQLDGGSVVINWIAPSSKPFACMYRHDSSCMASWRIHATRTPVNTTCLCDVARARKYGMFCTRASLIINTTFTTLIHSQFQAASLYFFRELGRV